MTGLAMALEAGSAGKAMLSYRGFTIRGRRLPAGDAFTLCCSIGWQKRAWLSYDLRWPAMGSRFMKRDCERPVHAYKSLNFLGFLPPSRVIFPVARRSRRFSGAPQGFRSPGLATCGSFFAADACRTHRGGGGAPQSGIKNVLQRTKSKSHTTDCISLING
jgi:hypothetical protein